MAPSANLETITNKALTWINRENPTRESMGEVARQGYHLHGRIYEIIEIYPTTIIYTS